MNVKSIPKKECRICQGWVYGPLCKGHLTDLLGKWENFLEVLIKEKKK